jgi:hypothetical protein
MFTLRVQPLTEPAVSPAPICRWKKRNNSSGGMVTSRISAQPTSENFWKVCVPSGTSPWLTANVQVTSPT